MLQTFLLGLFGISCGAITASGVAGLLISLSIIPRYCELTHTSSHLLFYEDAACLGTILGNIFYLFHPSLPLGIPLLTLSGIFFGIFLGSWILALAEMLSVFPIFARRLRLHGGFSFIILSVAFGKIIGCILFYYFNWS